MPLSIPVTMVFLRTMFVVMLMLDCLVCVYGERLEDRSEYLNCIANPAGCTELYAARPSPPGSVCEPVTRSPSLSGWADGGFGDAGTCTTRGSRAPCPRSSG